MAARKPAPKRSAHKPAAPKRAPGRPAAIAADPPVAPLADPLADAPVAIPERGEHDLELEGVIYRLRPSFAAIRLIEGRTKPLIELVRLGDMGNLSLEQMGIIAAELIKAGADEKDQLTRNVSAARISELIYEAGVPTVMSRLTMCLLDAMTGGRTSSGEAKAATA